MDSVVSLSRQATKSMSKTPGTPKITSEWPTTPKKISVNWDVWSILKIFTILTIIAALGFNVFSYLSQGTDYLSKIVQLIASYLPAGISKTLNLSVSGTKLTTDIAAGTIQDVGKIVKDIPQVKLPEMKIGRTSTKFNENLWKSRDKSLSDAIDKRQVIGINKYPQHEPDKSSSSSIQNPSPKSWCYVGTDRGYRSCVKVKNSPECASGKIFPSKTICINPSLRE